MRVRHLLTAAALAALMTGASGAATVVPLDHFSRVSLRDGGHVVLRHGATQSVTLLKGSTQFTSLTIEHGRNLEIETCNRHCPRNYELEIEIVSPDIDAVVVTDGGEIVAEGDFPARPQLNLAVSEGGIVNVRAMPADQVNAAVNQGGVIRTAARQSLNAAVNEGGQITYWGNPAVRRVVNDGGSIRQAEE